MTIVRPEAIRDRLALTTASLSGSRALVASSRIRIRGVNQGPGDRDPLLLSAGQVRRALFDISLVAVRHALDEFFGPRQSRGIDRVRQGQPRAPRDDVVADRAAEKKIVLQYDPEALAQTA